LSGFLITGILLDVRAYADRAGALKAFYLRRALRIFPAFYVTLALAWWADLPLVRASVAWHVSYLSNVFTFVRGEWPGTISHFWSLAVEEQFYLVWPWLIVFAPRRWVMPGVLIAIAIAPLFRWWLADLGYPESMQAVLAPGCLDSLGVGALLALRARAGAATTTARALLRVGLPGWLAILALEGLGLSLPPLTAVKQTLQAFVFGWLVVRATAGFRGAAGRWLSSAPVLYLGRISYGVYLAHGFAGALAASIFALFALAWPIAEPWRLIVLCAVTVGAAAISWHLIERPINAKKRHVPYQPRA
jgi:peptidoglycan/LPS O-acetylase OafA/YrhL